MYFEYGEKEIAYLKKKDKALSEIIDKTGHIYREVDNDLFSAIIHHIIGQQISTKAQQTIWMRLYDGMKCINADTIINAGAERLKSFGISSGKAGYILDCAIKIKSGEINLAYIKDMNDTDAIKELTKLKGVGIWTAEMLLLFCLMRKNILSYDDLAIQRGLRILHHHKKITRKLFEKYRKRYSPYCSVASLYIWAAAAI